MLQTFREEVLWLNLVEMWLDQFRVKKDRKRITNIGVLSLMMDMQGVQRESWVLMSFGRWCWHWSSYLVLQASWAAKIGCQHTSCTVTWQQSLTLDWQRMSSVFAGKTAVVPPFLKHFDCERFANASNSLSVSAWCAEAWHSSCFWSLFGWPSAWERWVVSSWDTSPKSGSSAPMTALKITNWFQPGTSQKPTGCGRRNTFHTFCC